MGGGNGGKPMTLCKATPSEARALPMRVRIQSTLLPSKAEQMENYQQHEVEESDSIQKLAIQYRVSVRALAKTPPPPTPPLWAASLLAF